MFRLAKLSRYQGPVTPSEITALLRSGIHLPGVRLTTGRSAEVEHDQVIVHGVYDDEQDSFGEPHIYVTLMYNQDQQHITLALPAWQRLCFDVAECVGHELVHRAQSRRRRFRPGKEYRSRDQHLPKKQEQQYLGRADEIEAYGFSIAAELAAMHGVFDSSHAVKQDIVMYQVYHSTFDTDQSVLLKLDKQISKYLCRLEADYYDQQNSKRSVARRRN